MQHGEHGTGTGVAHRPEIATIKKKAGLEAYYLIKHDTQQRTRTQP